MVCKLHSIYPPLIQKLRFPIYVVNKKCVSGQSGKRKQQRAFHSQAVLFSLMEVMFL